MPGLQCEEQTMKILSTHICQMLFGRGKEKGEFVSIILSLFPFFGNNTNTASSKHKQTYK